MQRASLNGIDLKKLGKYVKKMYKHVFPFEIRDLIKIKLTAPILFHYQRKVPEINTLFKTCNTKRKDLSTWLIIITIM